MLFVISGPSGAGKGTIVQGLMARRPELRLAVSCTTRPARPMEVEGVHYRFISRRAFLTMRDGGEFLEWAEVHGNFYGTPSFEVERHFKEGRDVLLEIDVQGAAQVKAQMPDAALIFIEAPSMQDLQKRLRNRGTDEDEIERRMAAAHEELRRSHGFDGVVVNVDIEQAVEEVLSLVDRIKSTRRSGPPSET